MDPLAPDKAKLQKMIMLHGWDRVKIGKAKLKDAAAQIIELGLSWFSAGIPV